MRVAPSEHDFFVGWRGTAPAPLRGFLLAISAALLALLALLALALGSRTDDPAGADFAPGPAMIFGDQESFSGRLSLAPYPVLHIAPDARHPRGRAVLLSGDGKQGAPVAMPGFDGAMIEASGFLLQRGSIAMLVLSEPPRLTGPPVPAPASEQLGRWRLVGEIGEGKCAAGGMRPGTGIGHRACAELCLAGEIPAVLVTTAPVAGSTVLLLADADGGQPSESLRALAGVRLQLDGAVERRGNLLVFLADPASIRRP